MRGLLGALGLLALIANPAWAAPGGPSAAAPSPRAAAIGPAPNPRPAAGASLRPSGRPGAGASARPGAAGLANPRPQPQPSMLEGPRAQAMWPPYPGARRVAARLGGEKVRIWFSADKPEVVLAYYQRVLAPKGWVVEPRALALAREGIALGEPAWLAFEGPGMGKLELTVVQARDPRSGRMGTMFYQEAKLKL